MINGSRQPEQHLEVPFATPFFYGWVVVAVGALATYFSGPGQTYGISAFVDAYIRHLSMSRGLVSTLYAVATVLAGVSLLGVGRLVDRWGIRRMLGLVSLGLGLTTLGSSFIVGPVGLFASFFFLRLFGQGSLTLIPTILIPQWFFRRRGRAMSLLAFGGLVSGASIPLINNWLIHQWGWPMAWRVWGALAFAILVPLVFWLVRSTPETAGLLPDGDVPSVATSAGKTVAAPFREESWSLAEAMGVPAFWLILFCSFVPAMVSTGLTFNWFSILDHHGVSRDTAAIMLSMIPVIGFSSALGSGFLLEKVKIRSVLALVFVLKLFELIVLYRSRSVTTVVVFLVMWGLSQGFLGVATKLVWPDYFGRRHLGSILSVNMVVTVIGSAFGPLIFGWAYSIYGGYQQVVLGMAIFPLLAIVAASLAKKPIRSEYSSM